MAMGVAAGVTSGDVDGDGTTDFSLKVLQCRIASRRRLRAVKSVTMGETLAA